MIKKKKKKGRKRDHRQNEKACPCPHPDLGGWDPNELFGGWFSTLDGFKTLIGVMGLIPGAFLLLPCLAALVLQSIRTINGSHYILKKQKQKNGLPCNDAIEIQTPRSR
jgi:hypothetical protein